MCSLHLLVRHSVHSPDSLLDWAAVDSSVMCTGGQSLVGWLVVFVWTDEDCKQANLD